MTENEVTNIEITLEGKPYLLTAWQNHATYGAQTIVGLEDGNTNRYYSVEVNFVTTPLGGRVRSDLWVYDATKLNRTQQPTTLVGHQSLWGTTVPDQADLVPTFGAEGAQIAYYTLVAAFLRLHNDFTPTAGPAGPLGHGMIEIDKTAQPA